MVKNVGKNRRKKIKNKKFLEKGRPNSVVANRGTPVCFVGVNGL